MAREILEEALNEYHNPYSHSAILFNEALRKNQKIWKVSGYRCPKRPLKLSFSKRSKPRKRF